MAPVSPGSGGSGHPVRAFPAPHFLRLLFLAHSPPHISLFEGLFNFFLLAAFICLFRFVTQSLRLWGGGGVGGSASGLDF